MKHRPRHVLEYTLLRLAGALVNVLPYRGALFLGWLCAALGYACARSRVREAQRRIRAVFADRFSAREVRRIAWLSWRNITFDAVEMLRVGRITPAWMRATTNCATALTPFTDHARTGRGAILALPHMGNWETAALACHQAGIPIFSLAARQKNPLTDAYINALRRLPGIETLARGSGAMRAVLRRLQSGGFLAILPDVRVPDEAIAVPFLGAVANIGPGMARFAIQTNVPIFPGYITRHGWSRQRMHVSAPLWPNPDADREAEVRRLTTAVMALIDTWIREHPEQWFWYNRRWILDPIRPADRTGAAHA